MTSGKETDPGRRLMRAAAATTPDCVPIEQLGEPLTVAQQAHVASCARCQTELALRAEFEDGIPAEDERLAVQWMAGELRRRREAEMPARPVWIRTQTWALVAAAASIVLVTSVGYLVWDREPVTRQPSPSAPLERGSRIDALAPTGDVLRAPDAFSWAAVEGAATYELAVMEVDRSVLWRESSSVSRVTPPATLVARLVPGKTVLWKVTARNAAGSVIAESGTARIRVITVPRGDAHGP